MENTTVASESVSNNTVPLGQQELQEFLTKLKTASAVPTLLLIPVIIVTNFAIIVTIVTNTQLRKEFRHQVIVSIALADILIGLIACPVRGDFFLPGGYSRVNCVAYLIFNVFEQCMHMFVGTWGIVTINLHYLLSIFRVKMPELPPSKRKLCVGGILALPWLAVVFFVLPVVYAYGGKFRFSHFCYVSIPYMGRQIILAFSFAIPAIIIFFQSVAMTIYYCVNRRNRTPSLMPSEETNMSPWVLVVAGAVTIGLVGIEQSGLMARRLIHKAVGKPIFVLYFVSVFTSDVKSVASPLIWFAFPELRSAFKDLLKKLPRRQDIGIGEHDKDDTTVSYMNLKDDLP